MTKPSGLTTKKQTKKLLQKTKSAHEAPPLTHRDRERHDTAPEEIAQLVTVKISDSCSMVAYNLSRLSLPIIGGPHTQHTYPMGSNIFQHFIRCLFYHNFEQPPSWHQPTNQHQHHLRTATSGLPSMSATTTTYRRYAALTRGPGRDARFRMVLLVL